MFKQCLPFALAFALDARITVGAFKNACDILLCYYSLLRYVKAL